jgi:hypothetical protein
MKNNIRRVLFLLLFCVLLPSALLAQEQLTFVVKNETVAFTSDDEPDDAIILSVGEIIVSNADIVFGKIHRGDESHIAIGFEQNNRRYFAFAKDFRPLNTEDVFGEDIFIDYPMDRYDPNFINTWGEPPAAIGDAMWVPYFYADILRGQDRNMLLIRCPRLELQDDYGNPWYENSVVNLQHGRAMFYNSAIMLGMGTHLAVRNIQRTDFGYIVDSIVSTLDWRIFWGWLLAESVFWETYNRGDTVILFLHLDGDYLDIYTAGTDIHVGTFIRVGREFQTQYQSLIRTNTADLTNVQWPRRAEGSTGIPPVFVVPDNSRNETLEVTLIEYQDSVVVQQNNDADHFPLWLWFAIIGGVIIAGGVVVVVVKMKG